MSLLDRFLRREKASPRQLFSMLFPETAPGMKEQEYVNAYRGWVYACVKRISDAVAQAEFKLQEKKGDDWEDVTQGNKLEPLNLLDHVNPYLTSDDLFRGTQSYLELVGNSFWYVAANGRRKPAELWQLDPTEIKVIEDGKGGIAGYKYRTPKGREEKLNPGEVIPFIDFSPTSRYRGIGSVGASAVDIDIDTYASTWNRNFFHNQAMPAVALMTQQNLTDDQYERLVKGWEAKHRGLLNAHKPAVLEGGLDVKELTASRKEMDFVEYQRFLRDKILAIFGVPKPVLGITEDVNRSTAKESEYVFAKYTVQPRIRFLASRLTEFYLPLWDLPLNKFRIVAEDVVPQDVETELKRRENGLRNGYYTINEVRAEEGLEPIDGGDVPYVESTRVPLGSSPPSPGGAEEDEGEGNEPEERAVKTKDAAPNPVAKRVVFLTEQIERGKSDIQGVLGKQQSSIVSALRSRKAVKENGNPNATDAQLGDLEERVFTDWEDTWVPALLAVLTPLITDSHTFGGRQNNDNYDIASERAASWIRDRGLASAKRVNDTMKGEVRERISQGIEAGKGAREIATDIEEFYGDQGEWRALRVARTEVMESYAQGSLEGARQAGITEKRWITAGDARVDEHCRLNAEAGWIKREENFPSGHVAPVPHPFCRCVLEFR